MNIENYLQNKIEEYGNVNVNRMIQLYEDVTNNRLRQIFSKIHFEVNELLKYLNERLPRYEVVDDREFIGHYTAAESRELIKWIDQIGELQSNLRGTNLEFELNIEYKRILDSCNMFLNKTGGSPIPKGTTKVTLILTHPIFEICNVIKVKTDKEIIHYPLKFIGEGSYANVHKYKDKFYDKYFVVKSAKEDLTEKEYERFKREFNEMKNLKSPYVVEVFSFCDKEKQYIMEFMDDTLYKYINENNNKLTIAQRKLLVNQLFKAFAYIHSKGRLHRDISLRNILLKKYEDVTIVKISDFGLVKVPGSTLTDPLTEFKGSLNDPQLKISGFDKYEIRHETYALTWVIYFIMTGRTQIKTLKNSLLNEFVLKGINSDLSKRYQNITQMKEAFQNIDFNQI